MTTHSPATAMHADARSCTAAQRVARIAAEQPAGDTGRRRPDRHRAAASTAPAAVSSTSMHRSRDADVAAARTSSISAG